MTVISDNKPQKQLSSERPPVVLFGGTFDPIHFGHLRAALEIRERLDIEELRLLPCHIPGHRNQPDSDAQHRSNMIRLAIECDSQNGETGLVVDMCECESHQPSYTVNTLLRLREEAGPTRPLVVTLGMDSFNSLPQWHRWEELLTLGHLLVLQRPGSKTSQNEAIQLLLQQHLLTDLHALKHSAHGGIWIEEITPLSISATKIRQQISRGHSARYLLPDIAWSYIKEHRLYGYETKLQPINPRNI